MSLKIDAKLTGLFFKPDEILKKAGKAKQRAQKRMGAFIRRSARQSLRKRRRVASPGQPPSVHSPEPNLKTIYFVHEPETDSLVVGPVQLNQSTIRPALPGALEHGGRVTVRRRVYRRGQRTFVRRAIKLNPHPFMGPALDANVQKFPDLFKEAIG